MWMNETVILTRANIILNIVEEIKSITMDINLAPERQTKRIQTWKSKKVKKCKISQLISWLFND